MSFFPHQSPIKYRYYDPKKKILGKTMEEHLRFSVCFWHSFCWEGVDMFGQPTFDRSWLKTPEDKVKAGFEFLEKLGLKYYTFHDVDVAPPGTLRKMADLLAHEMERTKIKLLWGTANLTGHPRYMAGASTNPNPEVFAHAVHQVKEALDVTHQLHGENYVLWGGREGYETLLNTDLRQELDQYGRFLSMLADYKHKIGFKGSLMLEPKPCEPMKHMYDFDCATAYAFLQRYGLENEYKMNIEANHATLAGHTLSHEVAYSLAYGIFGSIDANQGDYLLGWDTDNFPTDLTEYTHTMYLILKSGGFKTGGMNFDAKLRRQSIDLQDLFDAHVNGIETLSKALIDAAALIERGEPEHFIKERYAGWKGDMGQKILRGELSFEEVASLSKKEPKLHSGRQEWLEGIMKGIR